MKKIFTLFAALMMVFSMNAATKTIYCKMAQGWWKADGAAVGAYYWGTGTAPNWPGVRMTPVAGETDLWSIDIDTDKYQNIIFTRVNGSGTESDWGAKTADLTVPTDDKNLYTITSTSPVWGSPGVAGNWSVYAPDAPKTYKDITITIVANATPKIHYWEGGDKVVGTEWDAKPEMVATGEENTYSYTIKEVDEATGVKYLIVVGDVQSADQQAFEDVNKNFKELLPQVSVMGVKSWDGDKMTVADDYLSASVTLTLEAAKDYELKLTVNGEWFGSNAITITKDNNSASFAENGDGNGKLTTDLAGDYVFTYTYATKTLVVTYPAPAEPEVKLPAASVRAWAYDLALAVEDEQYTFSYKATTAAKATLIFSDAEGVELATKDLGLVEAGVNTAVLAASELPEAAKINWAIKLEAGAIAEFVEVTDASKGIYNFYLPQGVAVDNNPESATFGTIYVAESTDGASDGGSDRADTQKRGIFVYNQNLEELNPTNVGIIPSNVTLGDASRQALRRVVLNPVTNEVVFAHNVVPMAVWAVPSTNVGGEAKNLIEGLGFTNVNAICFDEKGALYVLVSPGYPAPGSLYKVENGVVDTLFADNARFGNADVALASDGRGGVWIAQNRGQLDGFNQLTHVNAAGAIDYEVNSTTPNGFESQNTARGTMAYNYNEDVLALGIGASGAIGASLYQATYDEAGVPTLTFIAATPSMGKNVDGLAFDYAGDLYGLSANKERFYKFAVPTATNVCTTPAASKYAIKLVEEYTVKATVNPAETGVIAGLAEGGVYVKGAEATLTATAAEGYEFVNWTVADSVVSTEATYTFVVEANVELVANFKEAAIEYMVIEEEITNLVIDTESMALIGGPSANFQVEIFLGLAEDDNMDGKWSLSAESSVTVMGQDVKFLDGYAYDIDVNTPAAKAVLHVQDAMGAYYELQLNMTAAAQEALVIEIADATVAIDTVPQFGGMVDYALNITANWTYAEDGVTYPVSVYVPVYYPEATEPSEILCTVTVGGEGDNDPWLGFGEGTLTITTVDGVVTVAGTVNNQWAGFAANVNISGKLPVQQDPETGVDNIQVENTTVKVVEDGQVFIIRNGVKFNANGAVVK